MRRSVVIVGLGNIGSQLAPLVARMRDVGRIVLVDQGRYDEGNVETQDISAVDVGEWKAQVQGLRLERITPGIVVEQLAAPVEALPLGRLRADAILACVDSRAARQYLNQAARHLGVPLVDAGVKADQSLVRVSVYLPSPGSACLECGWDQADYDAIEQVYPCQPDQPLAPPTGAPAHLGALAAALQAIELRRLLSGEVDEQGSHELIVDAASRRQLVSTFRRRLDCRLADHGPWDIESGVGPDEMTFADAIAPVVRGDVGATTRLSVDSVPFVSELVCPACGVRRGMMRLRRALTTGEWACVECGARMVAVGPGLRDEIGQHDVPLALRSNPLRSFGLDAGDILTIRLGGESRHIELGCATKSECPPEAGGWPGEAEPEVRS
jgi:molybdopterin/thiamine biosynthesis adenylyltransferase